MKNINFKKKTNMENKKEMSFWNLLEEHPIRTIIIVSLVCDAAVGIAKSIFGND